MRNGFKNSALYASAATLALCVATSAYAQAKAFDIPSEDANKSIPEFARQAGIQIIAPGDQLRGVQTPAIKGSLEMHAALAQLLAGTGAKIASDDGQTIVVVAPKNVQAASSDGAALSDASVESVLVTSTRVNRADYLAPTPVSIIGIDEIKNQAPQNIADLINKLPALNGSQTPGTLNGSVGTTIGQNLLNLRGLGTNRTLVLLDGQRITPNTSTGNIDINLLPSALIKRIDVVTGGASADWGSDAVAGVVNLILDRHFEGLKGDIQAGETQYGDDRNIEASLTFGTDFAGDRGHFEISSQYRNQGPVGGAATTGRSWYQGYKVIGNPDGSATNIVLPNVGLASATDGGVITAGALKGTQFIGLSGTPAPFNSGFSSGLLSVNGSAYDLAGTLQLQGKQQEGSVFTRISYELTPSITAYAEANYATSLAVSLGVPYNRFGNVTINTGNPFIPASVQAAMTANKITSFSLGTTDPALGNIASHSDTQAYEINLGVEGSIGNDWTWNARFQNGEFDQKFQTQNDPIVANYNNAVNAVTNTTTGQIVCASTAAQAAGCIPLNLFGTGNTLSQGQKSYLLAAGLSNLVTEQNDFTANIKGSPFSTWAGIVSLAAGMEYRTEHYGIKTGGLDQAGSLFLSNGLPASGSYDVIEGYLETVVPLLTDLPFVKELDFNGAVRETSYSQSGAVTTWKAGLTYGVTSDLNFRGVWSTDIRAPNLNDLYATGATNVTSISDPVTNSSYQATTITSGNTALKPEVAHTESAGAVYQPSWLPGMQVSADYFNININNAIISLNAQQIVSQCAGGVAQACALVTRGANNVITSIHASPINSQSESTAGFDLALAYKSELSEILSSLPGDVTLRASATKVAGHKICALGQCVEYAGTNGDGAYADPSWRGLFSASYDVDDLTATVTSRFIGSGIITNRTRAIVNNDVPAIAYFDLSGAYKVAPNLQGYFIIQNIADQSPPISPSVFVTPQISNGVNDYVYDALGRQFRIGIRFSY